MITVGGLDRDGNRAIFRSDKSTGANYGTTVDISAPAGETWTATDKSNGILSTMNSGTTTPGDETYAFYQGTSMATPHVSGLVALMLGKKSLTPSEVEAALKKNARAIPGTCDEGCGAGLIDAEKTIAALSATGTELFANPGFESGAKDWSATTGVINSGSTPAARSGSWKAGLNGVGKSSTHTLSQSVSIPSTATAATLSFYLRIDSSESGSTVYDTLKVQLYDSAGKLLTTLATYSNTNENTSYELRSFDVKNYIGKTVTVKFTGSEDYSLQTTFLIDDTSLSAS